MRRFITNGAAKNAAPQMLFVFIINFKRFFIGLAAVYYVRPLTAAFVGARRVAYRRVLCPALKIEF